MKARLVAIFVNNDIVYDVQIFNGEKWICTRSFDARERKMAFDYLHDMTLINVNKYDVTMKFPNTILGESNV